MKLSKHSKTRIIERTTVRNNKVAFFRNALLKGKSPGEMKDGKVKNFLLSKTKNCKVKLYKNYVFVYSKNSKQLYTLYKLPDRFLEEGEQDD